MSTPWGHVDAGSMVSIGVIVLMLAVAIPVFVHSSRATARVNRMVDEMNARQLPQLSTAAAQVGTSRTFQVGQTLSLTVVPLRTGMRLTATISRAAGGADLSVTYPLSDELAGEIAAKLQRSRD